MSTPVPETRAEWTIAGEHAFLASEVEALPRSTPVLDLGCGTGAWLARLHAMGFTDLTGVDRNPPRALNGVTFLQDDLDRPGSAGRRYGLVTAIQVIEHVENPGMLLARAAAALDEGGTLLIATPNIHSLRARVKFMLTGHLASFDHKGAQDHITPILLPAFVRLAAQHGLVVKRCWTYPQQGTLLFGRPVRVLAGIARLVAADPLPGDSLCITLAARRSGA
jgi:SAM-dependent methyltransferase